MYMTKEEIQNRVQEHYEIASEHGELFGVFLRGSQNYINDLFFKESDVDTLAVFVPNKREICLNHDISQKELILDNTEHIDRFDIRKLFETYKKSTVNNLETLFTEYFVINPKYEEFYNELIKMREEIAYANKRAFALSTMGISLSDLKTLEKRTGNEDLDIQKLGYSRKRLSNIMRFNKTLKAYHENKSFNECLKSLDQKVIYEVRRTEFYNLEEARELAEKLNSQTLELAKKYEKGVFESSTEYETYKKMDDLLVKVLETKF